MLLELSFIKGFGQIHILGNGWGNVKDTNQGRSSIMQCVCVKRTVFEWSEIHATQQFLD